MLVITIGLFSSADDAKVIAEKMLGNVLVTKQTGPSGQLVNKV